MMLSKRRYFDLRLLNAYLKTQGSTYEIVNLRQKEIVLKEVKVRKKYA